jgi:hypothetical protein
VRIDEMAGQLRNRDCRLPPDTEVHFERLRDDIRLVAEGLAVVGAKVDRLTRQPKTFWLVTTVALMLHTVT